MAEKKALQDHRIFRFRMPVNMRWSDMDELSHVNNAIYLTYMEEGRAHYLHESHRWDWKKNSLILAHISIDYLAPLHYLDKPFLYMRCSRLGGSSFDIEYLMLDEKQSPFKPVMRALSTLVFFDYDTGKTRRIPDQVRAGFLAYEKTPPGS